MQRNASSIPILIGSAVIVASCFIEWLGEARPDFTLVPRLEWMTYDWRVRQAARHSPMAATNLGFVAMDEESLRAVANGSLPYRFGLLWPRQVYARMVDELTVQGAAAIGFDILLADLRPDHGDVPDGPGAISSDEFFARSLRHNRNVYLAAEDGLFPPDLFATNSLGVAHVAAQSDPDGILRRTHAFVDVRVWHPVIQRAAGEFGWDLDRFASEGSRLLFPRLDGGGTNMVPLDAEGRFNAELLERQLAGHAGPRSALRFAPPWQQRRLWHLGIVLAAHELNLDLDRAEVDLKSGLIRLAGPRGLRRELPVDAAGRFYINWSMPLNDHRLLRRPVEHLLHQHEDRRQGKGAGITNEWAGRLVVVGSSAVGNNLSDVGATPLEARTFLVSGYWNVASSLLTGRFIHPVSVPNRMLIILLLGGLAIFLTLNARTLVAVGSVGLVAVLYLALAIWAFSRFGWWLPVVTPLAGALVATHVTLITWLVRAERRLRRHTTEIFRRVVAPEVVHELLDQKALRLGGARRNVTVFFADIRGFTEVTDASRQRAEEFAAKHKLAGPAAGEFYDAQAGAILDTVNPYLSLVADVVKRHGGTLDKFIGDCVMAFWGAPIDHPGHAASCVRAAVEAQRAVLELNRGRQRENERRIGENARRAGAGQDPLPLLDLLTLGSGINTGPVTVGLVGSEAHLMNYTVFGREVNLASRLEGASGRARILISAQTYQELLRADPELAAACTAQPPLALKGFREPIQAYEVAWHSGDVSLEAAGQGMSIGAPGTHRETSG